MEVIKKYLSSFICLKKSSIAFAFALLFLGIFVPTEFAYAAWWNPLAWGADVVLNGLMAVVLRIPALIFMFVLQLILSLSSVVVWLAGLLLATIINLDIPFTKCPEVGGVATDCFVDTAWTLTRDIANMALIIALVVIAFATMLRQEGYGFKKALLPLIGVALLINFSKVIVGVVVDISTVIMQIFLNEITGLEMLTSSFANQGKELLDYFTGFKFLTLSGNLAFVIKTTVLILFQLGFAFILGLYALVFLARYVALWLLTILAPFAFVAFILPATRKGFNAWWSQLISWSFVGVTMGFFLWLGKLFASKIDAYKNPFTSAAANFTHAAPSNTPMKDFIIELLPYAMLLIFLYATFMLALKTNAMGANMIIKTGKKWGSGVAKAGASLGRAAAWKGTKVAARKGVERVGERIPEGLKNRMGKLGSRVSTKGGFLAKPAGVAKSIWKNLPDKEKKKLVDALLYRKSKSKKEERKDLLEKLKRGDITAEEFSKQLAKIEERDEGPGENEEGGAPSPGPSGGGPQTPGGDGQGEGGGASSPAVQTLFGGDPRATVISEDTKNSISNLLNDLKSKRSENNKPKKRGIIDRIRPQGNEEDDLEGVVAEHMLRSEKGAPSPSGIKGKMDTDTPGVGESLETIEELTDKEFLNSEEVDTLLENYITVITFLEGLSGTLQEGAGREIAEEWLKKFEESYEALENEASSRLSEPPPGGFSEPRQPSKPPEKSEEDDEDGSPAPETPDPSTLIVPKRHGTSTRLRGREPAEKISAEEREERRRKREEQEKLVIGGYTEGEEIPTTIPGGAEEELNRAKLFDETQTRARRRERGKSEKKEGKAEEKRQKIIKTLKNNPKRRSVFESQIENLKRNAQRTPGQTKKLDDMLGILYEVRNPQEKKGVVSQAQEANKENTAPPQTTNGVDGITPPLNNQAQQSPKSPEELAQAYLENLHFSYVEAHKHRAELVNAIGEEAADKLIEEMRSKVSTAPDQSQSKKPPLSTPLNPNSQHGQDRNAGTPAPKPHLPKEQQGEGTEPQTQNMKKIESEPAPERLATQNQKVSLNEALTDLAARSYYSTTLRGSNTAGKEFNHIKELAKNKTTTTKELKNALDALEQKIESLPHVDDRLLERLASTRKDLEL